ncbi:MAG: 30S ribosomal protein S2 [Sedimentisphaerales bacterium]|nr:30S ribosomal protein S2 [Sedimentisphaerales bacterium]MBN2841563.1 30S ribosomal protein S2 [Sedimentisphaerales bacterium]
MDNNAVRALIDAGIHFGHRAGRWNPKMKPYIFCTRNSIHIIDIKETIKGLVRAQKFIESVVASGKDVLFVGTKRQARSAIVANATACGMPYVSERWLGGTLTNFGTIRKRLARLEELEAMEEQGLLAAQSKKMESTLRRELTKVKTNLEGIRNMSRMPGCLVLVDAMKEHLAIAEAKKLRIPTICLMDTDSDPDDVNIPIPGNDDAMKAIEIILAQIAEAVAAGKSGLEEQKRAEASEAAVAKGRSRRLSVSQMAETSGETAQ